MQDSARPADQYEPDEWVVWNGSAGILLTAALGRVEYAVGGRRAWLAHPFDMVGPFSLDELETEGRIAFAACTVMSRQRWQDDQAVLRREAFEQRRAAQARIEREYGYFHGGYGESQVSGRFSEREHREALNLPGEGELEVHQIKAAFRRLAQKAHPDVGGSHEQFVRITEARDALLERAA